MPRIQPAPLARVVPLIVAMLAIPAALTLRTVLVPGTLEIPSDNPTPHGYTWSLLLFVFPLGVIAWWFLRHPRLTFRRRAYWLTVGILAPIGFVLDILLGHVFFEFPNRGATLGLDLPGIGGPLPIEEFVFYLAGFLFILLFYIWNDEFWLRAYNVPDYAGAVRGMERIVSFHPGALLLGAGLFLAALLYKKLLAEGSAGFPGYFSFLLAVAFVPAVGLFRSARPFINWRAFGFTSIVVVLISLLWEVTLALPYGWWGFKPEMMIGLTIGAWSGLPIEEVFLWFAVTFTTVVVFEIVKIWQASGRGLLEALLGMPVADS
jgi:lycopene cyclase domain-containing protein